MKLFKSLTIISALAGASFSASAGLIKTQEIEFERPEMIKDYHTQISGKSYGSNEHVLAYSDLSPTSSFVVFAKYSLNGNDSNLLGTLAFPVVKDPTPAVSFMTSNRKTQFRFHDVFSKGAVVLVDGVPNTPDSKRAQIFNVDFEKMTYEVSEFEENVGELSFMGSRWNEDQTESFDIRYKQCPTDGYNSLVRMSTFTISND